MLGHLDATLRADEEALLAQKAPAFEGGGYGAYARRGDGGDAIDAPRTAHTLFVLNPRRAPLAAALGAHASAAEDAGEGSARLDGERALRYGWGAGARPVAGS